MESASPEPPRRVAGAAVEGRVAADDPPHPGAVSSTDAGHRITVLDEQADVGDDVVDVARIERLARHVLIELDVPAELELSITCVDAGRIAELNRAHLGGSGPTDVLAFPIDGVADVVAGVPGVLGDVVVCPAVAAAQASAHGRTAAGEVDLLVVHGVLHLLGHDHAEDDERARMFGLTDDLLAGFAKAARGADGAGGAGVGGSAGAARVVEATGGAGAAGMPGAAVAEEPAETGGDGS